MLGGGEGSLVPRLAHQLTTGTLQSYIVAPCPCPLSYHSPIQYQATLQKPNLFQHLMVGLFRVFLIMEITLIGCGKKPQSGGNINILYNMTSSFILGMVPKTTNELCTTSPKDGVFMRWGLVPN